MGNCHSVYHERKRKSKSKRARHKELKAKRTKSVSNMKKTVSFRSDPIVHRLDDDASIDSSDPAQPVAETTPVEPPVPVEEEAVAPQSRVGASVDQQVTTDNLTQQETKETTAQSISSQPPMQPQAVKPPAPPRPLSASRMGASTSHLQSRLQRAAAHYSQSNILQRQASMPKPPIKAVVVAPEPVEAPSAAKEDKPSSFLRKIFSPRASKQETDETKESKSPGPPAYDVSAPKPVRQETAAKKTQDSGKHADKKKSKRKTKSKRKRSVSSSVSSSDHSSSDSEHHASVDIYSSMAAEQEAKRQQQQQQIQSQLASLVSQGVPMQSFKVWREQQTIGSRCGQIVRAFIAGVCTNGLLRIVLENESFSRLVALDDISIPSPVSRDIEERRAAKNAHELLEHILLGRLVLVLLSKYYPSIDRLLVKVYMPVAPPELESECKMLDTLTQVQPEDVSFELPAQTDLVVSNGLVCINSYLLRAKRCYIVMGTETPDWYVRVSDWRRHYKLVAS